MPGPCRQVVWPKGPMECAAGVSWQRRHEGSWSQGWDMERDHWKGDINIDRMTSEKHTIIVGSPEYPDFDPYTVYTKVYILIVVSICCQTQSFCLGILNRMVCCRCCFMGQCLADVDTSVIRVLNPFEPIVISSLYSVTGFIYIYID